MENYKYENLKNDLNNIESPILQYYAGKTVLITGGLGFLGQLYIDKLLRSYVEKIYVLVRPKKGKTSEERFEKIFKESHFDKLRQFDSNYRQRIQLVEGDLREPQLGICDTNLKDIIENVQIIIHAAADVRFDQKLEHLILTNLKGTLELLKIAEKIKKLQVFSYISTAYSNCYRDEVKERFYAPPFDPKDMIEIFENCNQQQLDIVENLTGALIKPWPNAYVFSKCLSEDLVHSYGKKFPVCVIRPSIIISTFEDPEPGWCDNIYGLNGVLVLFGCGLLRILYHKLDKIGNIVCADFVIGTTLVGIWNSYVEQQKLNEVKQQEQQQQLALKNNDKLEMKIHEPEIYHVCTSLDRPVTWKDVSNITRYYHFKNKPKKGVYYLCYNSTGSEFMYAYYSIIYHLLPSLFIDLISPKVQLTAKQRKIQHFSDMLKFFTSVDFKFYNPNYKKLLAKMTPEDSKIFISDIRLFDYKIYGEIHCSRVRKLMDELVENLKIPTMNYDYLRIIHLPFFISFYLFHFGIFYIVTKSYNLINYEYIYDCIRQLF